MSTPDDRYLSHRRRAAAAVLGNHLEEGSLTEALWLLQKDYTSPGVSCLIAFVDAVTARFGIDQAQCKRLYADLFHLLNAVDEQELPADPWPLMNSMAAPQRQPNDSGSATAAQKTPLRHVARQVLQTCPKAQAVFAMLLKTIHADMSDRAADEQHQFTNALDSSIEQMTLIGSARTLLRQRLRNLDRFSIPLALSLDEMSAVVHAAYIAACLAIGRADADGLLDRAVSKARKLPESHEFPPERLLWSGYLSGTSSSH
jgi:hypothetical protein